MKILLERNISHEEYLALLSHSTHDYPGKLVFRVKCETDGTTPLSYSNVEILISENTASGKMYPENAKLIRQTTGKLIDILMGVKPQ
jgi:hypothetical protein